MTNEHFLDLPEWDDQRLRFMQAEEEEEGEQWHNKPTREACKALYQQWRHVVFLLKGALSNDSGDHTDAETGAGGSGRFANSHKHMMIGDAHIVAVKIRSSEAAGIYIARMENASIIRQHAQGIYSGLLLLEDDGLDTEYIVILRNEIDVFRDLFKAWVNSFVKDEFEDEWGLYV